ncbi:Protein of unknown function [Thermomonospora echinospora]|uniref:DUF3040 domain-containing protein n=1 Tax=Thermomonospora echinospora TaxID=1992 RepID=A0A1H6DAA7_9ACTN|nr:DUF3040 domain-containing protein [Thermomonospora echinospora]SEG81625.1 Protein of unknown function [Thermomonospora echinospora]
MALSMEEQRILAEIETHLVQDDPKLADRLSGLSRARWRRRMRLATAMVTALAVVAMVAMAVT